MLISLYSVSHPVMIQLSVSWHQISIFLVKLEAVWSREQYQVILNGGQWGMLTGELITLALKSNGIDGCWDQNAGNKFIFNTLMQLFFNLLVAWMPWIFQSSVPGISESLCCDAVWMMLRSCWCFALSSALCFVVYVSCAPPGETETQTEERKWQMRFKGNADVSLAGKLLLH